MQINLPMDPFLYILVISLLGLVMGSFLNVVIYRLPKIMDREWRTQCLSFLELEPEPADDQKQKLQRYNLSLPASHCPKCKHQVLLEELEPAV